jgi:hypothetical protein
MSRYSEELGGVIVGQLFGPTAGVPSSFLVSSDLDGDGSALA